MLDQELLTQDEVVGALGVSEQTVRRWWRAGHMPKPLRFGRRLLRWRKCDIDEFLAGGSKTETEETIHASTERIA